MSYPKWKFNKDEKRIVQSPDEEKALGSGWSDAPPAADKEKEKEKEHKTVPERIADRPTWKDDDDDKDDPKSKKK